MRLSVSVVLMSALLLAGCSGSDPSAPPTAQTPAPAARGPSAAQQYVLYEQMLESGSAELAVPLGDEILKSFPDSDEARRVKETIEPLRTKASGDAELRRVTRLWSYEESPMSGGRQSTASIYSNDTPGGARVRLVLRRHTEWGQSVFLYGEEPGYTCARECRVAVRFDDDKEKRYLGSIPPTGEPAIFIEEDKAFIARLEKAERVSIETTEMGKGARTLVFDVAGYEPARFQPMPKK